jgi:lipopolysaccharide export system protein LptC
MPLARPLLSPALRANLSQALRLGLPLGALVLMSTIFLASRSVDPNRAVAMSGLDLDALTREPRIGTARIAGVSADDAAINIAAASIRSVTDPKSNAPLNLIMDRPDGALRFAGGGEVVFRASTGQIDQSTNIVILDKDVWLRASTGYEVTMSRMQADLQGTTITGTGPVRGTGPAGTLSANALTITALPDTSGGYLLAFKGDVRLLYSPQQ